MTDARDTRRSYIWPLAILAPVFAALTFLDWYRFAHGIGEETLWMAARVMKLAFTAVCAATVWAAGDRALDRRDRWSLSAAFAVILAGDAAFFLGWSAPAVGVFALAQVAITARNASGFPAFVRAGGLRAHAARAVVAGVVVLLIDGAVIAAAFRPFLGGAEPAVAAVGVIYALFLSASVWAAWMAPVIGRFASTNAWMIAVAMTMFYLCDVTVGLGGVHEGTAAGTVARNLTWAFYGPALVLLARSGGVAPASDGG